MLQQIRELGIRISLDDFGTGFANLRFLIELPLDRLKIDRSFVTGLFADDSETQKNSRILSRTIIGLGHAMGKQIIAEGVETVEQYELLKAKGCDLFQGYLFSRPLWASEIEEKWLKKEGGV